MKKRRIPLLLSALLALLVGAGCLAGCEETPSNPTDKTVADGWYVLESKTVDGADITAEYVYNCISLKDGAATLYEVDFSGKTERDATYTVEGDTVNILVGVKTYDYLYDGQTRTMRYEGKVNKQEVVMVYRYDEGFAPGQATGGASFFEELFGESLEENFYNYCPTVMREGNDTLHVWYCSNRDSGVVTDYVAYRKGTLNANGGWDFSEKQLVLSPTPNSWDYVHTCDPSVVKGAFRMGGENYSYLMAYLGCATTSNSANEVGIAVAKSPEGPWVKVDSLNPIADFIHSEEYNASSWGYGQPCVISSDNAGKVLLFYSKGVTSGTHTYVEEWDLSDLDDARKLREARLWDAGVTNASGGSDVINNADFAFDPYLNRLYCIKEDFPYPTDGGVNWITGSNTLMYLDLGESGFDTLFCDYRWNVCGKLTREITGKFRNHNCGIVTDEYGRITNPFRIPVLFTVSDAATDYPDWGMGGQWPALHTYRLYGYVFDVK